MSAHALKITLAGIEYSVPKLNIGQLREVTRIFANPNAEVSFDVLRVAMSRASPKVENIDELEADASEIGTAVGHILEHAGLKKDEGKNPHRRREPTG